LLSKTIGWQNFCYFVFKEVLMKKYLYALLLIAGFTTLAQAQPEKRSSGLVVPRGDTAVQPSQTTAAPTNETKTDFKPKADKEFDYPSFNVTPTQKEFSMFDNEQFASRADDYKDRVEVKPRGESNDAYKGNQYFGEVKSKSKYVQVMARDFEYVDGDRIKVLVNDVTVVSEITLSSEFKGITITLEEGFNKIEFEALNQGTSGPNTAEFRIYDDKQTMISSNQWNLATGFKASIMIVKDVDSLSQQQATQTPPDATQGN
jgi:hypothetical protein